MTDDRIEQIRAVLALSATQLVDDWDNYEDLYKWADNERSRRIRAILDRPAPAPRVFFPGDTVPADTVVINQFGQTFRNQPPWQVFWSSRGMVEVFGVPTREAWAAIVNQAKTEREVQS